MAAASGGRGRIAAAHACGSKLSPPAKPRWLILLSLGYLQCSEAVSNGFMLQPTPMRIAGGIGGLPDMNSLSSYFGGATARVDPDTVAVGQQFSANQGTKRGAVWLIKLSHNSSIVASANITEAEMGHAGFPLADETQFGASVAALQGLDGPTTSLSLA